MKLIGLIGGMSWESSLLYYRIINETVKQRLGGLHSARCLLYSVDFALIEALQQQGDWEQAADILTAAAQSLYRGGADFIVLCTNTMHKVAGVIQAGVSIPLLHIADPTAAAICDQSLRTVGLLGTRFTMEQEFYKSRLSTNYGLTVLVPDEADRVLIHQVIYQELCLGVINPVSKQHYLAAIERLIVAGAEALILGCTEIGLLITASDCAVPVFDTTYLHAIAAVDAALGQQHWRDEVEIR